MDAAAENHDDEDHDVDITDAWSNGALEITRGGTYVLSGDVETDGMLSIAAPADETVALDFRGHTATVNGAAYAGIDVGASAGQVVITDTTYKKGVPEARLRVEGNRVADALCGIQANYVGGDGQGEGAAEANLAVSGIGIDVNLNTVDASTVGKAHDAFGIYIGYADENDKREAADVSAENVSVSVSLNKFDLSEGEKADLLAEQMAPLDDEATGIAYGIYTNTKHILLGGVVATSLASSNNTCDLYSVSDAAFELCRTSKLENALRVYAAGNADNTVLAYVEDGLEVPDEMLALFENATDNENVVVFQDGALVFAQGEEQQSTEKSKNAPFYSSTVLGIVMSE